MKGFAVLMVVLAFAVCATTTLATAADFRGEVWTWDEKEGWVTLRMGAQDVRILVADKSQLKFLQLHSIATIRGELAPQTIETVMLPTPAGVFVPVGTPVEGSMRARVASVDPKGVIKLEGDRGASELWIAEQTAYRVGDLVLVETTIRSAQFTRADQAPALQPAAGISSEPGDYATVTGRILSRNSDGRLTVDSPRGPIQVWVAPADVDRFKVGDYVQVRSRIRVAS